MHHAVYIAPAGSLRFWVRRSDGFVPATFAVVNRAQYCAEMLNLT